MSDYRIAFFSKHKRRTLYSIYIMNALRRIGCDVRHINTAKLRRIFGKPLARRLIEFYLNKYKPDAGIIFSGDILHETLDYLVGHAKTAIILDDHFSINAPVTEKIKKVDVFFHTMTGQLDEYRAAGVRHPVYAHSGVDPDSHRIVAPRPVFTSDVAFIGKAIYRHRIDFILALHRNFDIKVYGRGWQKYGVKATRSEIAVKDFARVCAGAKIIVGMDKVWDKELYFSNRTWFVLGCGGFLLTRYIPGLESLFANHRHLVWFEDNEEAADHIGFYLKHESARMKIARCGNEFVHRHYPFDRMAANILSALFYGKEPKPLTDPGPPLARGEINAQNPANHH